jgi:hypothetical protein
MQLVALGESFNGDDVLAFARRRQGQTGQDTLSVDDDRARFLNALMTTFYACAARASSM